MSDAYTLGAKEVMALIEKLECAREYIRQLEEQLVPSARLPEVWGLAPLQDRLLRAIRAGGSNGVSRERLMVALYGMQSDPPGAKVLDVYVCKIRQQLDETRSGIAIDTLWGTGWRMPAWSCTAFDQAVAAEAERWEAQRDAA